MTVFRVIKSLEKILSISHQFPLTEPQNPDLQEKLEEIRTKFKQVSIPVFESIKLSPAERFRGGYYFGVACGPSSFRPAGRLWTTES